MKGLILNTKSKETKYFTTKQVAKYLSGKSGNDKKVLYWINKGLLKSLKVGKSYLITRENISEFTGIECSLGL